MKQGFTIVETVLTLGIIAITAGVSVPMYQNYQIHSNLDLAVAQTVHNLGRAQLLSQTGQEDGQWGVRIEVGTVFFGSNFETRDEDLDETIALPAGISVYGIEEVVYSRIDGTPSPTGDIILEAESGERRTISISTDGTMSASGIEQLTLDTGGDTGATTGGENSGGETSGDTGSETTGGYSGGDNSGDTSGDTGDTGSSGGDSGGGDGGSSGGGGSDDGGGGSTEPTCEDRFSVANDGTITTTGTVNATVKALGAEITYGANGPDVQVRADISTDGGATWNDLFNDAEIDGGEQQTISGLGSNQQISIKVNGRYSWLFNKTYVSNDNSDHIQVLRNGDSPPQYDAYNNQDSLESFLQDILDDNGKISIGEYDVVLLTELGTLGTSSSDFQDAVFLIQFDQPTGSCADESDPRFKIEFDRLENTGKGDVQKKSYVGQSAWAYGDGQWIPLLSPDGQVATDGGLVEDVQGLAVQRQNGFVRVLLHGSLSSGKEIVDARITFDGAKINALQNVTGNNKSENPFNGVVNDGPGGDEATVSYGSGSLLFQTRVTGQDDAIDIYWTEYTDSTNDDTSSDDDSTDDGDTNGDTAGGTGGGADDTDDTDEQENNGDDTGDDTQEEDQCAAAFTLNNGLISVAEKADVSIKVLGSNSFYGNNGPEIQMHMSYSTDKGVTWNSLYDFRDINGGEQYTLEDLASGSTLMLRAEGRRGWLFKRVTTSGDGSGRMRMLRNNNADPNTTIYRTPTKLKSFMRNVIKNRKVSILSKQILTLVEMQDIDGTEDFQDAAILITIEKPASQGICGQNSDSENDEGDSSSENSNTNVGDTSGTGDASSDGSTTTTTDDNATAEEDQIQICHFPPGNTKNYKTLTVGASAWSAHAAHGDRKGECEGDEDGDGIPNSQDLCSGTYSPEPVPTEFMLFKRYALTRDSFIFHEGPRKRVSNFTLEDTFGCSCEQMVDVAEGVKSYRFDQFPRLKRFMRSLFPYYTQGARKYGCGKSMIRIIQKNASMK